MDGNGWVEWLVRRGGCWDCVSVFLLLLFIYTHFHSHRKQERERERERKKERRTDCSLSPSLWSFALSPPLFVDVCDAEVRNGNFDLVDEVYARRVLREQADQNS